MKPSSSLTPETRAGAVGRPYRLLIIAEEGEAADCLRHAVEKLGYAVAGLAHAAGPALERIGAERPDAVLLDLALTSADGAMDLPGLLAEKYRLPCVLIQASAPGYRPQAPRLHPHPVNPRDEKGLRGALEKVLAGYAPRSGTGPAPESLPVLLRINTAIATIRERKELFAAILEQIKPAIPVDDTGIVVLDQTGTRWQDWTNVNHYQNHPASAQLQQQGNDTFQPVDRWLEYTLNHSGIMTIAQFREGYPEHPFGPVMWEAGLREMMFTPLVTGGRKLGVLFFDSQKEDTYTEGHLALFQALAGQVAVAVANILANEEILQREREKSQLLEITELIAQVKATDDLLRLIVDKIKPLFGFHDCGLFVVSSDGKTHSDLAAVLPEVSPSDWNKAIAAVSADVAHEGSVVEWVMNELEAAGGPVLFDFKELMEKDPDYPQLDGTGMLEMGYRDCLAASLTVRGKSIGFFCINALKKDFFAPAIFPLFQSVTHTIAIAVANILSNEEILEREREKSVLLSISEDIASVRDKVDLLRVVIEKIKPLFGFYDCGILVVDKDDYFHDLVVIHPAIDGSDVNRVLNEQGFYQRSGMAFAGSALQQTMQRLEKGQQPVIFDYTADTSLYTDYPLLATLRRLGYQEGLAGLLKAGRQTFGCFFINYLQVGQAAGQQTALFQNVVEQLSVAVANILANEEILEREREKALLLSLSEDMTTIRDRNDLWRVISQKIQPLFSFDDAVVTIVDREENTHYILMISSPRWREQRQEYASVVAAKYPLAGSVIDWIDDKLQRQDTLVLPMREVVERFPKDEAFQLVASMGVQHMLWTVLRHGNQVLGSLNLHANDAHAFDHVQLPLVEAVADQVAVAVANILANEEILEREREKALLLSLSEDMATIRDREDLWRVMMEKIRPLVDFDDAVVVVFNPHQHSYNHFLTMATEERKANSYYANVVRQELPLEGSAIQALASQQEEVYYWSVGEYLERYPGYPGFVLMQQTNLHHSIAVKLRWGGDLLGLFLLHYNSKQPIQQAKYSLYKSIADQVAVAVANILANEEILEREREKSQLLEISKAISQISHREDLLQVIIEQIKPLFHFDENALFVIDRDRKQYRLWYDNLVESYEEGKRSQQGEGIPMEANPVAEDVFRDRPAYLRDREEMVAFSAGNASLTEWIEASGTEQVMVGPLKVGGQIMGCFNSHSRRKGTFSTSMLPLYQNVCDQVAVAVANILANEEILEREQEKSQLLEITKLIAQVKVKEDLLKLIVEKIRPLFGFHDCGLFVVGADGTTHSDLAALPGVDPSELNQIHAPVSFGVPHRGSLIEWMMQEIEKAGGPVLFDFKDLVERYPEYAQFKVAPFLESGYRDCLAANLVVRGKAMGMFCLNALQKDFFKPNVFSLFQSVAHSVAIAVANIFANEEILEREREKSRLLEISQSIASVQNHKQLLKVIYQKIKPVFPYDNAGLFVFDQTGENYYEILHAEVLPDQVQTQLTEAGLLGPYPYRGYPPAAWMYAGQPAIYSLVEQAELFAPGSPERATFQIGLSGGLRQMIGGPLYCGGKKIGLISFNARQDNFYTGQHLPLFQAVADQVAVAVANILANEEILQREREKATLLSISGAISSARNAVELLTVIREKAQKLIPFYDTGILIVEPDGQHHYDLSINVAGWDNSEANLQLRDAGLHRVVHAGSYVAHAMHLLAQAKSPLIEDWETRFEEFDYPFFTIMQSLGFKQAMVAELKSGGKVIGALWLNSLEKNHFYPKQFEIFQALADQVAVAVANILANEEILQREREKSLQIAITQAMAEAGSWEEKFMKVGRELDKAVPFHHIYFSINAPAGHRGYGFVQRQKGAYAFMSHADFVQAAGLSREEFLGLQEASVGYYAKPGYYTGSSFTKICETYALERAVHRLFGHQSALNVPVQCENGMLIGISMGSLEAGAYGEAHLALLGRLMPAITLALEKLLAYEDIQQREKEKTLQIAVNTTLSQEGTWQEKFLKVAQVLEEIIPWDLVSFNLDFINRGLTYVKRQAGPAFLSLEDFMGDTGLGAGEIRSMRADAMEHFLTRGIYSGEAYQQLCRKYPFKRLASQTYGVRSSLNTVSPIRDGQSIVITFASRRPDGYRQEQLDFLERIIPSISLAVQKLLAYEEIEGREREKALQVAVIHALTEEGSWEQKLLRLTRVLQTHIPLDYLFLVLEKDKQYGRGYGCLRIGFDEYQVFDTEGFFRMTGLNAQKYLALREQRIYTGPELLAGEAFEKATAKYGILKLLAGTFQLQSNIAIPLRLSHPGRFVLNVLSKKPLGLTPEHLALLEKISAPLALTLENLLAYEEIKGLKERLEVEKEYLEDEINVNYKFEDIIGASQSLKEVFKKVSQVAAADSTVLVLGETGTGKELIARAIHNLSRRGDRALVKINCAALPAQLIESELFGHEKGAFTGAVDRRIGKFELAHGSTIFLDEVGELPLELQAKLLRAIQEKEVERLGGNKIIKTDVRIIAATNRNLEKEVAQGRFRSDLYFRLNVFPITLPPLRNRKEDIPLLAVHFIRKMSKKLGKNITGISNAAIKEMQAYNWPGNIRELEHIIERAAITSSGIINELGLPEKDSDLVAFPVGGYVQQTLAQHERALIMETLKRCNGRIRGKGGAAELLDIEPNTLDARMKKLGIVKKQTFENGV
jgi:transcriptional regulator with GAF, ATPase, and Fis domain/CheY-like chemotaxis protein